MAWKWTFTKRFALSKPQRKFHMLRACGNSHKTCDSLGEPEFLVFLCTLARSIKLRDLPLWASEGEQGGRLPWILKISAKKGCFLSFEREKTNFTNFGSPRKTLEKSSSTSPWEKSFRRPCLPLSAVTVSHYLQTCLRLKVTCEKTPFNYRNLKWAFEDLLSCCKAVVTQ